MSRKYHPDANINNPNKDEAERKFKEVQQAYEQIMKERTQGAGGAGDYSYWGGFGGFGSYGGFGGGYQQKSKNLRNRLTYAQLQIILTVVITKKL